MFDRNTSGDHQVEDNLFGENLASMCCSILAQNLGRWPPTRLKLAEVLVCRCIVAHVCLQAAMRCDDECADQICANSRFTAQFVRQISGREPLVVYPPVSVSDFAPRRKEDLVVRKDRRRQAFRRSYSRCVAMCDNAPGRDAGGRKQREYPLSSETSRNDRIIRSQA